MSRRAVVVTLDACGVGALPDAAGYGDAGAHTLAHLAEAVGGLDLPVVGRLGLGLVGGPIAGLPSDGHAATAVHGRLAPRGPGKDSTTGHWELMGAHLAAPLPTYPDGFGDGIVAMLEAATGRRFCCKRPYDGLAAIRDFGERHLATGELILYTSQDSVAQLAAHAEVVDPEQLVAICATVRATMSAEHGVGRVIARPFAGPAGAFARIPGRRDFALAPPRPTALDALAARGVEVHAVGKVSDLFGGRGIAVSHPAADNETGLAVTGALLDELAEGLVFTNLIDTDQLYSHRKDVDGFHAALRTVDLALGGWLERLRPGDLLVLTADHGCDPAAPHSDHTREHVPLLATGPGVAPHRHDGAMADVGATVHRWLTGVPLADATGTAFA